ncbi:MAG: hypothetical protein KDA75_06090 [Planctomycetaceae bacterium]|nr:hypothetical protein [Planctomycetaceae bacterium]
MQMQDLVGRIPRYLIHDRDTKFTQQFDEIFKSSRAKAIKLPICSPNLNAHCERVIRSIQQEVLDHFIVFGEHHLNYLAQEYTRYDPPLRPHQGIDNQLPAGDMPRPESPPRPGELVCEQRQGGLLKHFAPRAE